MKWKTEMKAKTDLRVCVCGGGVVFWWEEPMGLLTTGLLTTNRTKPSKWI